MSERQENLIINKLVRVLSIALALWCMIYLSHVLEHLGIVIAPPQHQAVFLGLLLSLTFLVFPAKKGRPGVRWYDWILILLSVVPTGFVALFHELWQLHGATTTQPYELVFSAALLISLIEALRRAVNITLSILTLLFVLHPPFSSHLPGILFGRGCSFERVGTMIFFHPGGIFGLPLNIAATILIAFLLFGQLLLVSGAGQTIINLAMSLTGRVRGGGAKAAIIASGLFGSLNGQPPANAALTGTFTIPLMKATGYKPDFAGGVEAAASTGGSVLPPVMGIVAFIMAEWLQVSYVHVAMVAFMPAALLYLCMFIQVDFAAGREGLSKVPASEIPSLTETLKTGWIFFTPLAILIYFLFVLGYTPETSAFWATISVPIVTALGRKTRLSWCKIGDALSEGTRSSIVVGLACSMAGIMMGSVAMSGLAVSLSMAIVDFAAGNLFVLLLLAALASFVFGMGIGAIASYIFVVIMVAPALIQIGIPDIAAHLFVFWYAMSAFITPPYCVAAFVTSAIAKSSPMRTALQALRIGIGFILIPLAFMYNPGLILQGSTQEIIIAGFAVAIGLAAISAGLEGYLLRRISWWEQGLLCIVGIMMLFPSLWIRLPALGIIGAEVLWQIKRVRGLGSRSY